MGHKSDLAGSLRASIYPVLRFTPLCSKSQDIYFNYSLAGPTFISKTTIDTYEPANSSPSRISWAWERRRISNIDGRIGRA